METNDGLQMLGWRPHFAAQLSVDSDSRPARVMAVHRGRVVVNNGEAWFDIAISGNAARLNLAVGDWVLLHETGMRIESALEPFSLFQRRAAGTGAVTQKIAANVDSVFIVTSANRDFNLARLERYLALAHDAGVFPIVVLSKADCCDSVAEFTKQVNSLSPGLCVEAIDARDAASAAVLRSWCELGQTVALLGSSGVGKSTLVNTLCGEQQSTAAVRADDQRGRHTTTARSMHRVPDGGWLLDTPGMRELQLVDVADGIEEVFADLNELAENCRFADCSHQSEPGCAVLDAIDKGLLSSDRLKRYRKLQAEDRFNSASVAERRERDKQFGKMVKSAMSEARSRKKT